MTTERKFGQQPISGQPGEPEYDRQMRQYQYEAIVMFGGILVGSVAIVVTPIVFIIKRLIK
jgi:hypothetical protein